jgi:hypothetical protein
MFFHAGAQEVPWSRRAGGSEWVRRLEPRCSARYAAIGRTLGKERAMLVTGDGRAGPLGARLGSRSTGATVATRTRNWHPSGGGVQEACDGCVLHERQAADDGRIATQASDLCGRLAGRGRRLAAQGARHSRTGAGRVQAPPYAAAADKGRVEMQTATAW